MKTNLEKRFEEITGINFNKFYKDNYESLIWQLSKFTKNNKVAEDFTNIAFMRALDKIETYDASKKAQVHTWLHTIAVNMVKQDYRSKQKNPTISIDKNYSSNNDEETTISSFLAEHDSRKDLEEQDIVLRKSQIIKDVISNELPPKYRRVMELRLLRNLPYKEVQEQLEIDANKSIPLSTVKSQIKKGRELIQDKVMRRFEILDKNGIDKYLSI